MIDILLLAETVWMMTWFQYKGLRRTVLYAGGIVSAGYAGLNLTNWLAKTFIPPTSSAFLWIQSQIATDSVTVKTLSPFLPPVPVWAGFDQSQWIALHIIRGLLLVSMTGAVFLAFLVTGYLTEALWDRPNVLDVDRNKAASTLMGAGCGLYLAAMTGMLFINLAWLKSFPYLTQLLQGSLVFRLLSGAHVPF